MAQRRRQEEYIRWRERKRQLLVRHAQALLDTSARLNFTVCKREEPMECIICKTECMLFILCNTHKTDRPYCAYCVLEKRIGEASLHNRWKRESSHSCCVCASDHMFLCIASNATDEIYCFPCFSDYYDQRHQEVIELQNSLNALQPPSTDSATAMPGQALQ